MTQENAARITGYHAHVYYNAATREAAGELRAAIEARFEVRMGQWHDRPVGPHPQWSYQVAFAPDLFAEIVPWLALNHGTLTLFVHPQTGDDIADHTLYALWLGRQEEIDIEALR